MFCPAFLFQFKQVSNTLERKHNIIIIKVCTCTCKSYMHLWHFKQEILHNTCMLANKTDGLHIMKVNKKLYENSYI